MNRAIKIFLILIAVVSTTVIFNSCVNLKSEYPSIDYYRLVQPPPGKVFENPAPIILQVRNISAASELETNLLFAVWEKHLVHKYYYHRWINDCPELITDFIVERINRSNIFSAGALKTSSVLMPDYYLEGQLMEFIAHSIDDDDFPEENYTLISIKFTLIKREPLKIEESIALSKIYDSKVIRPDYEIKNVPAAFSTGLAQICDSLMLDIKAALK